MATKHTLAAACPAQSVEGVLSSKRTSVMRPPSNCPDRIVARVRPENPSRWRLLRSPFRPTSLWLPSYTKRSPRPSTESDKSSEWKPFRNATPREACQGSGNSGQVCREVRESVPPPLMSNTNVVHAMSPHDKGKSGVNQIHGRDDNCDQHHGNWSNESEIKIGDTTSHHVGSRNSMTVPLYYGGDAGFESAGTKQEVREIAEDEESGAIESKSSLSSNNEFINGYAEQPASQTVKTSYGSTSTHDDGFDSHLHGEVAELSSMSPDSVKIHEGGGTTEDDDSMIARDGSAYVVTDVSIRKMSTAAGVAPVSHENTTAINHPKVPEPASEVSFAVASASDVGERGSNLVDGNETSSRWRAAMTAAFKTKSKALNDQPNCSSISDSATTFQRLELKPAPDDEGEVLHVRENLENKHILITGVTGFLAKVLVEKILRTQPGVGQLYLLTRAGKDNNIEKRMADAVFGTSLFKPLREEYGDETFVEFVVRKVTPVSGDIAKPDLNLSPTDAQMLMQNLDVIISSAATTKFDERYDTAIEINVLGPVRLLDLAKRCRRLSLFQHISTAYVNGKRKGVCREIPFEYGQSLLSEISGDEANLDPEVYHPQFDLENEIELALKTRADLELKYPSNQKDQLHPQAEKEMMKLGAKRAEMFGWTDTYTLTKAMGEQIVQKHKEEVPVVIIRPSVVESTVRFPFDGWIEGQRMLDPIVLAYGKGYLKGFLADPDTVLDVIPVDIVVNVILAAMVKHGGYKQRSATVNVYQVASSVSNPLTMRKIADVSYSHFKKYPMVLKGSSCKNSLQPGKEIRINYLVLVKSEAVFRFLLSLFFDLPLKILNSPVSVKNKNFSKLRVALKRYHERLLSLTETYKSYTLYEGRFEAANSEKLLTQISSQEQDLFGYSVKNLDWVTYLDKIHIPGLRQYVLRWNQTGRIDPDWTIIDPPPDADLLPTERKLRLPSRGLFQLLMMSQNQIMVDR